MANSFHMIGTGGTIEHEYDPYSERFIFRSEYKIPCFLKKAMISDFSFESIFKKDSLDINDEDRSEIVRAIRRSKNDHVIITHGFATILETAHYIDVNLDDPQIIILTGSIYPITYDSTEAIANISLAVAATTFINSGVYIAAHGHIRTWDKLRRDKKSGLFIE